MKHSFIPIHLLTFLFLAAQLVAFPTSANAASGALSFTDTEKTVTAGKANSWMKPIWDISSPKEANSSTVPDIAREFTVSTKKTDTGIKFTFKLIDVTRENESDECNEKPGNFLCKGESIKIFINPHNSRDANLQGDEHQFEIAFARKNLAYSVSTIEHLKPKIAFGNYVWGTQVGQFGVCTTASSVGTPGGNGSAACNIQDTDNEYTTTVEIGWSELGMSSADDFGLAIALINDLGVNNADDQAQLTASSFPLTMPVNNANNPYEWTPFQLDPAPLGGVWAQPNQWGVGYVNTPETNLANVQFDLTPSEWYSSSIRIAKCSVAEWATTQADAIARNGVWKVESPHSDQTQIPGWYKYYSSEPCQMGIWIKATNGNAANVSGKLLVLWGQSNTGGGGEWTVVTLTDLLFVGGGDTITHQIWSNVTNNGPYLESGLGACLRVYLLPDNATGFEKDDVLTDDEVWQIQARYPTSPPAAQMNFSNFAGQTETCCVNGSGAEQHCSFCESSLGLQSPPIKSVYGADRMLAENSFSNRATDSLQRGNLGTQQPISGLIKTAVKNDAAEVRYSRSESNGVVVRPDPMVRVDVTEFGVEEPLPGQSYVFVEAIGGLGWAGRASDFTTRMLKPFVFQVGNPSVSYIDYSTATPTLVPSPVRSVFLAANITAEQGAFAKVNFLPFKGTLAPGEVVEANAVVTVITKIPPALEWWQWLILILLLLLLLLLLLWRKPQPD